MSSLKKSLTQHIYSSMGFLPGLIVLLIFTAQPEKKMPSTYSLLCLGDSYTIGESVSPIENFPSQTVQLLRKTGHDFETPEIVAKTGWTTGELQDAINRHSFRKSYDFVTLLIGVNNQYRGLDVENYKPQFESLLKQAIQFANGNPEHVIVLSIPDWGVTPFAKERDQKKIAEEIDAYNKANRQIAEQYKAHYLDITPGTRKAVTDPSFTSSDSLHPSGKEYAQWAEELSIMIHSELK